MNPGLCQHKPGFFVCINRMARVRTPAPPPQKARGKSSLRHAVARGELQRRTQQPKTGTAHLRIIFGNSVKNTCDRVLYLRGFQSPGGTVTVSHRKVHRNLVIFYID